MPLGLLAWPAFYRDLHIWTSSKPKFTRKGGLGHRKTQEGKKIWRTRQKKLFLMFLGLTNFARYSNPVPARKKNKNWQRIYKNGGFLAVALLKAKKNY